MKVGGRGWVGGLTTDDQYLRLRRGYDLCRCKCLFDCRRVPAVRRQGLACIIGLVGRQLARHDGCPYNLHWGLGYRLVGVGDSDIQCEPCKDGLRRGRNSRDLGRCLDCWNGRGVAHLRCSGDGLGGKNLFLVVGLQPRNQGSLVPGASCRPTVNAQPQSGQKKMLRHTKAAHVFLPPS